MRLWYCFSSLANMRLSCLWPLTKMGLTPLSESLWKTHTQELVHCTIILLVLLCLCLTLLLQFLALILMFTWCCFFYCLGFLFFIVWLQPLAFVCQIITAIFTYIQFVVTFWMGFNRVSVNISTLNNVTDTFLKKKNRHISFYSPFLAHQFNR